MTALLDEVLSPDLPEAEYWHRCRVACRARLTEAFNADTALFDRQLRDGRWAPTLGTEDLTSTAIVLIGLDADAKRDDGEAAAPPTKTDLLGGRASACVAAMVRRVAQTRYLGGLGLVLWANALWEAQAVGTLLERLGLSLTGLESVAPTLTTMETAWLVSGLVHEMERGQDPEVPRTLSIVLEELLDRFEPGAMLFRHAGGRAPASDRFRRWIANFADQIYPVQALSFAGIALHHTVALDVARRAADRLLALQGPLGQWWWQYDVRRNAVARPFPVYAVHQHGMAPMALTALGRATGRHYDDAIAASRGWLRRNEGGIDMFDPAVGTIWRDLAPHQTPLAKAVDVARALMHGAAPDADRLADRLVLNRETRPYEWGWLLYAEALGAAR